MRTDDAPAAEGDEKAQGENQGYQPRPQRPYNNQGGQQGGYQRQQRPYGGQGQQGGYQQRPGQRPYNKNNRQQGPGNFPRPGKSFTPRPKRVEYEVPIPDPNEQIRLNKYMSNAGICSRREADEYIQQLSLIHISEPTRPY